MAVLAVSIKHTVQMHISAVHVVDDEEVVLVAPSRVARLEAFDGGHGCVGAMILVIYRQRITERLLLLLLLDHRLLRYLCLVEVGNDAVTWGDLCHHHGRRIG